MTEKRIYCVTETQPPGELGQVSHLVRAASAAQAIRHVASPRFTAEVAEQEQLVSLLGAGVKVQTAGES